MGQNVALKAIDLGVQSVQLHEVFERGFPPSLVRGYAVFLCCNSLSCALGILMARHSAMVEILVDSVCVVCFGASTIHSVMR